MLVKQYTKQRIHYLDVFSNWAQAELRWNGLVPATPISMTEPAVRRRHSHYTYGLKLTDVSGWVISCYVAQIGLHVSWLLGLYVIVSHCMHRPVSTSLITRVIVDNARYMYDLHYDYCPALPRKDEHNCYHCGHRYTNWQDSQHNAHRYRVL